MTAPKLIPAQNFDYDTALCCPIRTAEPGITPICWGRRCAAFMPVEADHGYCALITPAGVQ